MTGLACLQAGPVPVQTFYVPLPEDQVWTCLKGLDGSPGSKMQSFLSVAVTGNNTVIYYDHWEDGYENDLANPLQASTEIWGDGNSANGIPPGFATDTLYAGDALALENRVNLPRNPSAILFDGRDKIGATKGIVVTRAEWADKPGIALAGAVEVTPVRDYGLAYESPIGEDLSASSNQMFEFVSILVMASQDGTSIDIDADGAGGAAAATITLNEGEAYLVDGGIQTGAMLTATKPVQAHLITGDIGSSYGTRWYTLYPTGKWSASYCSPVGTASDGEAAFVFAYNPNPADITINYDTKVGRGSFLVPAGGTSKYQIPMNTGARFTSGGGENFFAIEALGANPSANLAHDWGFSLVPEDQMTTALVVGWGPGSDPSEALVDGSPVWLTACADTSVFIDYDGDGVAPNTDPNGVPYDLVLSVDAMDAVRVTAPDKDQTGMHLWTVDGTRITAAWGQDPGTAATGSPYLDLGTTVLPFPVHSVNKTYMLLTDSNGDGLVNPGETVRYTVSVDNDGLAVLGGVIVLDTLPSSVTYVADSCSLNGLSIADDAVGTAFPFDGDGYLVASIAPSGDSIITYDVTVNFGATSVVNSVNVDNDQSPVNDTNAVDLFPDGNATTCSGFAFTDAAFAPAVYNVGNDIYLTIADNDRNTHNGSKQTVFVSVTNTDNGDYETLTLEETGNDTGIFRSIAALPSSNTNGQIPYDGTVFSAIGHHLQADYDDPLYGDSCTIATTIAIPTETKFLYLTGPGGGVTDGLDRIDPVGTADTTTATTAMVDPDGGGGGGGLPVLDNSGIAVWSNDTIPNYNYWSGAGFGTSLPGVGSGRWRIMQGAYAPNRDEAMIVGIEESGEVSGMLWNGNTWTNAGLTGMELVEQTYWWSCAVAYEQQSGNALIVYGGDSNNTNLMYGVWDGTSWLGKATVPTWTGGAVSHMRIAANPTSDEMVLVVSARDEQDYVLVWNGSSWGTPLLLDSTTSQDRTDIYVAYESLRGAAMVVYENDSDSDLHYRVWDGSLWSSEGTVSAPSGISGYCRWTVLASDPGSDRIVLGVQSATGPDGWVCVWNGASWGASTLLTESSLVLDASTAPNLGVGFEAASGDALAVYGRSGQNTFFYRTWNSGIWSDEQVGADFGSNTNSMILAPDPASDRSMLVLQDDGGVAHYVHWDGSAWGEDEELAVKTGEVKNQPFVFLWKPAVASGGAPFVDVLDDFTPTGYDGNDGTTNWAGNWTEIGDDNDPLAGSIWIQSSSLYLRPSTPNASVYRAVDLTGIDTATLSYTYRRDANAGTIHVRISTDLSTWTTLKTYVGAGSGTWISESVVLDDDLPVPGMLYIRFVRDYGSSDGGQYFDNVAVNGTGPEDFSVPVATDGFTSGDYAGGSGWNGDWAETDAGGGGAASGRVFITGGRLQIQTVGSALVRGVDLSAMTSAELSFHMQAFENGDDIWKVEANDGSGWVLVDQIDPIGELHPAPPTERNETKTYQLEDHIALTADVQIRFAISQGYGQVGIQYVSLDDILISGIAAVAGTGPDDSFAVASEDFTSGDYVGGSGWSADWAELSDDGSPSSGDVFLIDGRLRLQRAESGAVRSVDLSSTTSAELSFHMQAFENGDDIWKVEANDGSGWVLVEQINPIGELHPAPPTERNETKTYQLEDHIALTADVQIRFVVTQGYGQTGVQYVSLDDIRIFGNIPVGPTTSATFTQSLPMQAPFAMPAGGAMRVVTHVDVIDGAMPNSPDVTAILRDAGSGSVLTTLSNPTFTADAGGSTATFRDTFDSLSYARNDGTALWSGAWLESDVDGTAGPGDGTAAGADYVGILGGRLRFHWTYAQADRIQRSADLSGYTSATLSFDWETVGLTTGERVSVLVSATPSASPEEIGFYGGSNSGTASIEIPANFITAGTTIHFTNLAGNWAQGQEAYFDNVTITARTGPPTGTLTWTTVLANQVDLAAGSQVELELLNAEADVDFEILYDGDTSPSRIEMPTQTVIEVTDLAVYDAPYPGGTIVTGAYNGATLFLRATVTDPFGVDDITALNLTIDDPVAGLGAPTPVNNVVVSSVNTKVFEYVWVTNGHEGAFTLAVTATEGYEAVPVTSTRATLFHLSTLDVGTPGVVEFTDASWDVPVESYDPNDTTYLKLIDYDEGGSGTVDVVVTSSNGDSVTLTLDETSPDSGIFTGSLPSSDTATPNPGDGILQAPAGATLSADYTDPNDPDDTDSDPCVITVPGGGAAVAIAKALVAPADGIAVVGDPVVYQVVVTNSGGTILNTVSVSDDYPAGLTFVSASQPGFSDNGDVVSWTNVGPLAVGVSRVITLSFTATTAGVDLVNSATAGGDASAGPATALVTVHDLPSLTVTKTLTAGSPNPAYIGDLVSYDIVLTNTGETEITTLPLTDKHSSFLKFTSASVAPVSAGGGTVLWDNVGPLVTPGGSVTITATFEVVGVGDAVANTAVIDFASDINETAVPGVQAEDRTLTTLGISIGDCVWSDLDGDGIQDANESGLAGVKVYIDANSNGLRDPDEQFSVTDADGFYELGSLVAGTYLVRVDGITLPDGTSQTGDPDGTLDSATSVTVTSGSGVETIDFGYQGGTGAIAGQVRNDVDGDGDLADADSGLAGITVELHADQNRDGTVDAGDTLVSSTTTDTNGDYSLPGLGSGDYVVVEIDPIGASSTNDRDNDPLGAEGIDSAIAVVLLDTATSNNNDFLDTNVGSNTIGGKVIDDANGDGTANDESGIPGVTVELFIDGNGNGLFDTGETYFDVTITGVQGDYLFTNVPDGNYVLVETDPAGATSTNDASGAPDDNNVGVAVNSGNPDSGGNDFLDTGVSRADISGTVFSDTDETASFSAGDTFLEGVTVRLYRDDNTNGAAEPGEPLIISTSTASLGEYIFAGLPDGQYVVVETDPPHTGSVTDSDGAVFNSTNEIAVTLAGIESDGNNFLDASANISGQVRADTDGNGDLSDPDSGVAGVLITLYRDSNGDGIYNAGSDRRAGTTTTDVNGYYAFTGRGDGNYVVIETDPSGADSTNDKSNVPLGPQGTDNTVPVQISGGAGSTGNDFLDTNVTTYSVAGKVTDGSDPIPGVMITLKAGNGNPVGAAVTDSSGGYGFTNLAGGDYSLVETDPAGTTGGSDKDGGDPNLITITGLAADSLDNDFVDIGADLAAIVGTVLDDTVDDNDFSPGDTPVVRVIVVALADTNRSGVVDAGDTMVGYTYTGIDGTYRIPGLPQGDYVVLEGDPPGATSENDTQGSPTDNMVAVILDGTGDKGGNNFLDDGTGIGSIGDLVFIDNNVDGVYDEGTDTPADGVTVDLWIDVNTNGQIDAGTDTLLGTRTTSGGAYNFTGLLPAAYLVDVTDTDGVLDGTPCTSGGDTQAVTLGADVDHNDADFGYEPPGASIAGQVRYDLDTDGDLADNEPGISGVTIELKDAGLVTIATTVTDGDGHYRFGKLEADDYHVQQTNLFGYSSSADGDGGYAERVAVTALGGTERRSAIDFLDYRLTGCNDTEEFAALNLTGAVGPTPFPTATFAGGWYQTFPNDAETFSFSFDNGKLPAGRVIDPNWLGSGAMAYTQLDGNIDSNAFHSVHTRFTEYHDFNPGDVINRSGRIYTVYGRGIFGFNGSSGGFPHEWTMTYDFTGLANGHLPAGTMIGFIEVDGLAADGESYLLNAEIDGGGTGAWLTYHDDAPNPDLPHGFALYQPSDDSYLLNGPGNSNDSILFETARNLTSITMQITQGTGGSSTGFKFMAPVLDAPGLGGTVRNDTADDDTLGGDEPGIGGVVVTLWTDPNGDGDSADGEPVATTVTDANGAYAFPMQPAGSYVAVETDPAGAVSDDDLNGAATDNQVAITVDGVTPSTGHDFLDDTSALYGVSGFVFNDGQPDDSVLGAGGAAGSGDTPSVGAVVKLYRDVDGDGATDSGEFVATTTTLADGSYRFPGLPNGNYLVIEAQPVGIVSEDDTSGSAADSRVATAINDADSANNNFLDDEYAGYTVSGQVRNDTDGDGDFADDDAGLQNILVTLYQDPVGGGDPADFVELAQAVTDWDGNYEFSGLPQGSYMVREGDIMGYVSTADTDGANDNFIALDVASGMSLGGNDFLDTESGTMAGISGRVFLDANTNGTIEVAGDSPLAGVKIDLLWDRNGNGVEDAIDTIIRTTHTGADGAYSFDALLVGNYLVVETDPAGAASENDTQGSPTDNLILLHLTGVDATDNNFLDSGATLAAISGSVFGDSVDDGVMTAGDTPVVGAAVRVFVDSTPNGLFDAGEVEVGSTVTDGNGSYRFLGLPQGDYVVVQTDPAGATSENDTDGLPTDNMVGVILDGAGDKAGNDFLDDGFGISAIGDLVFFDYDNNGSYEDGTDLPADGVTLDLWVDENGNGQVDAGSDTLLGTRTSAGGAYRFAGLLPGDYLVDVTDAGGVLGGKPCTTGGDSLAVSLVADLDHTAADFGYDWSGALGGTAFYDHDGDGIWDGGEGPAVAVNVRLIVDLNGNRMVDAGEPQAAEADSDASGAYLFSNLPPRDYVVMLDAASVESPVTPGLYGTMLPTSEAAFGVTLVPADVFLDAGVGFIEAAVISGHVFHDSNSDGTLSGSESGLENVGVSVMGTDLGGILVALTTDTGADGSYRFTVRPGTYTIGYAVNDPDIPAGLTARTTVSTYDVTPDARDQLGGLDFGRDHAGSVGDTIFEDVDGNGTQGAGEPGFEGVTVNLFDASGTVLLGSTESGSDGHYLFGGLPDGSYGVVVDTATLPSGYKTTPSADPDAVRDSRGTATVTGGSFDSTMDFGYEEQLAEIHGTVVHGDGNGIAEGGESPLESVILTLVFAGADGAMGTADDTLQTTSTNAGGDYAFLDLQPGSYRVDESDPEGYGSLADADGGDPNQIDLVLAEHEIRADQDFEDAPAFDISGRVIEDADRDGLLAEGAGEAGLNGVTVELWTDPDRDGDPADGAQVQTSVTSGDGGYLFAGVVEDDYVVVETDPSRYHSTNDLDGETNNSLNEIQVILGSGDSTGNDFLDAWTRARKYDEFLSDNGLTPGTPDGQPVSDPSGSGGNPDGDIDSNVLEHAIGDDPNSGVPGHPGFHLELVDVVSKQIDAIFIRPEGIEDVIYTLQGKDLLTGAWSDVAAIPAGQSAEAPFSVVSNGDQTETVTYSDLGNSGVAGLTLDFGLVRLRVDLDDEPDGTPDTVTLPSDGSSAIATASTKTFGWQFTDYNAAQYATHSNPFSNEPVFSGTVDANLGEILNVGTSANDTDLGSVVSGGGTHYLQITSGPFEGERFDIAGAGFNALTLVNDPNIFATADFVESLNTSDGLPAADALNGASFEVLPHRTFDQLFDKNTAFAGLESSNPSLAAKVLLYDNRTESRGFRNYMLVNTGAQIKWVLTNDLFRLTDQGSTPVDRTDGAYIHCVLGGIVQCSLGMVADHDVAVAFNQDYNLAGSPYPIDQAPADADSGAGLDGRNMQVSVGFRGGVTPPTSSQLFFWIGDLAVDEAMTYVNGYSSLMLLDGGGMERWINATDPHILDLGGETMLRLHRAVNVKLPTGYTLKPHIYPHPDS